MHFMNIFFTFVLMISFTFSVSNNCLVDVSVPDISASQANISWSYNCDRDNLISFKIYYDHEEYKACDEDINRIKKHKRKRKKVGGLEQSTVIEDLEPYSLYTFEVAAITKGESPTIETKTVKKVTEQALSQVLLKDLTDKKQNNPHNISFNWESPAREDCDSFHSELGYIFYKLKGFSEWNQEYFKEDNLSLSTTDLTISSLLPFSLYQMELYVTNREGQFAASALQTEILTGPSQPHQPSKLSVSDNTLQWTAPYPPTGVLAGFEVRWKHSNHEKESEWEISDYLEADEVSCDENLACYQLEGLETNQNYSFEVRAFNKDVEAGSAWSDMVSSMETENGLSMEIVLMVISVVTGVLILVILVVFLVHKCNIWNRLRGFKRTFTDEYSFRPIIRESDSRLSSVSRFSDLKKPPAPTTPIIITPSESNFEFPGNRSPISEVGLRNLTPTLNRASLNRRSCLDPLPPVPGKEEPIYDELAKPGTQPLDEDNYLAPNPARVASVESLDEEGYLRPNFHRLQIIDTKSPDRESLPAIPAVSYCSQDQLDT